MQKLFSVHYFDEVINLFFLFACATVHGLIMLFIFFLKVFILSNCILVDSVAACICWWVKHKLWPVSKGAINWRKTLGNFFDTQFSLLGVDMSHMTLPSFQVTWWPNPTALWWLQILGRHDPWVVHNNQNLACCVDKE